MKAELIQQARSSSPSSSDDESEEAFEEAPMQCGVISKQHVWPLLALAAWLIYLVAAMLIRPDRSWPLAAFTAICITGVMLSRSGLLTALSNRMSMLQSPAVERTIFGLLILALLIIVVRLLAEGGPDSAYRLQSLLGTVVLSALCALVSWNFRGIPWRVVISGFLLQFFLGFFVMKVPAGMKFFKDSGDAVTAFLHYVEYGELMVFGEHIKPFSMAFNVLPTIIFFSAFVACMYYLGVLQVAVHIVAFTMKKLVGTSMVQSVNAAANLFLGQSEAPLLIKSFLPTASPCDLHCVMVGGFASVSGSILACYIGMGVSASQLIGASVMSVPGTLFVSNLVCPPGSLREEEVQQTSEGTPSDDDFEFPPATETNVVEAAGNGAVTAVELVLNIGALLVAFISLKAATDGLLHSLGTNVGVPELSFELISSYIFWPLAWLLGTPAQDCAHVARLIGTKIAVNEFVAYESLGKLLGNDEGQGEIIERQLSERAELIATYALCGFSNIGSVGVQLAVFSTLCPGRKTVFAKLVMSAMLAGNVVCFMTATCAGILN
mmetsp:Transcript_5297/g.9928  ORF Transcript_5297/g.9928 Transcript_5297/m.9928 type:complete len:550 (-) Transcript_5297:373-2022(-)